jgi:hypothetical protein
MLRERKREDSEELVSTWAQVFSEGEVWREKR